MKSLEQQLRNKFEWLRHEFIHSLGDGALPSADSPLSEVEMRAMGAHLDASLREADPQ